MCYFCFSLLQNNKPYIIRHVNLYIFLLPHDHVQFHKFLVKTLLLFTVLFSRVAILSLCTIFSCLFISYSTLRVFFTYQINILYSDDLIVVLRFLNRKLCTSKINVSHIKKHLSNAFKYLIIPTIINSLMMKSKMN